MREAKELKEFFFSIVDRITCVWMCSGEQDRNELQISDFSQSRSSKNTYKKFTMMEILTSIYPSLMKYRNNDGI